MIYTDYWRRRREELARRGLKVVSQPTAEQVTLAQARDHLRIVPFAGSPPTHPDDGWITDFIPVAREVVEGVAGRALATQTLELALGGFPGTFMFESFCLLLNADSQYYSGVPLPMSPVQQVLSVLYDDGDGVEQTMDPATYTLDQWSDVNELRLAAGASWPTARSASNSVRVRYVAGYSTPDDSPEDVPMPRAFYAAMLMTLGHLYENREASTELKLSELPLGIKALVEPNRLRLSMA